MEFGSVSINLCLFKKHFCFVSLELYIIFAYVD